VIIEGRRQERRGGGQTPEKLQKKIREVKAKDSERLVRQNNGQIRLGGPERGDPIIRRRNQEVPRDDVNAEHV